MTRLMVVMMVAAMLLFVVAMGLTGAEQAEHARIRQACADRGGTPVDLRNASGELLAIRCDL